MILQLYMKIHIIAACGLIAFLATSPPLIAQHAGTEAFLEAELLALEAELDREQQELTERRKQLDLRKLQLQLLKQSRKPETKTDNAEDAADRVALLQAHAQAKKTRAAWLAEFNTLSENIASLQKGQDRIGRPRAFGPKAKATEESNELKRTQLEQQRQQIEQAILTSMQTVLSQKGVLDDTEYHWLQNLVASNDDNPSALDEATLSWATMILKIERDRRDSLSAGE